MRHKLSIDDTEKFDAMLNASVHTVDPGTIRIIYGFHKFVAFMSSVDSLTEFFSHIRMTTDGHFSIYDEIEIHPISLMQMSCETVTELLEHCRKVKYGEITNEKLDIFKPYCLIFNKDLAKFNQYLLEQYKDKHLEDVVKNGIDIFKYIEPHEVSRWYKVVKEGNNYDKTLKCFDLCHKFAKPSLRCMNVTDYCSKFNIAYWWLIHEVKKLDVHGNSKKHKKQIALGKLLNESKFQDTFDKLKTEFEDRLKECRSKNLEIDPRFSSEITATCHFMKHGQKTEYFEIARYAGLLYNDVKPIWTQDGSRLKYEIQFPYKGQKYFAVIYKNLVQNRLVIATVYIEHRCNERLQHLQKF